MNKEIIISAINASSTFQQRHSLYVEYTTQLGNEKDKVTPTTYLEIREVAKKRLEELSQLKDQMSKLEGMIPPDNYKQLISSIENEKALTSMLQSDAENFLGTQEKKYEESIFAGLEYEQESGKELNHALAMLERTIEIMIAGNILSNKISLEDVQELSKSLIEGSPFQKQIADLASYMERTQVREKKSPQAKPSTEQTVNGDLKPNVPLDTTPVEMQPLVGEQQVNPKKPTLADKIADISYSSDRNMVAEVQQLTVEDRMAQIAASLALLSDKKDISLKDMIQIHTLQEEQVKLESYVDALANQKLSRREVKRNKRMEIVTAKIEENKKLIAQSMENSNQYSSKIMRFFSARYQEKLADQVVALREKRGILQREQKMSAIAKYNRNAGKIVRSSRVLGTIKGMNKFKNVKLEELRALRNQVVSEFQNLKQDVRRFKSERGMLLQLQGSKVVIPDHIVSIDEHQRTLERSLA